MPAVAEPPVAPQPQISATQAAALTSNDQATPEDLDRMPDNAGLELVDGEIVEKPMSTLSSWVSGRISSRLDRHAEEHGGWALPDGTAFQCFPEDPSRVRKPDASWISLERLPVPGDGNCMVAPDLAVEVISPNDLHDKVATKIEHYRSAGVRLIWVVSPPTRTVRVIRVESGEERTIPADGTLTGDDVLSGFECPVADLFPKQPADETSEA